ncbi:hypothetical protein [uncultured Dokdonia sp.]|uniref:hypothetical protein n=1 Tax=uncultured Dokdonia sp. TaxID=575653 RepID=UPI00260C719C|nr:hypothetical protein [uncultured Dokdonia sp.]
MKKSLNYLPYVVVILIQFLMSNYTAILLAIILIGVVSSFVIKHKRVFLKSFLLALAVFGVTFFIYQSRIDYIKDLLVNLGLPGVFVFVFFPLINALNTAILFFFGYKIGKLFTRRKKETEDQIMEVVS